jgi:hypothetical protein
MYSSCFLKTDCGTIALIQIGFHPNVASDAANKSLLPGGLCDVCRLIPRDTSPLQLHLTSSKGRAYTFMAEQRDIISLCSVAKAFSWWISR